MQWKAKRIGMCWIGAEVIERKNEKGLRSNASFTYIYGKGQQLIIDKRCCEIGIGKSKTYMI